MKIKLPSNLVLVIVLIASSLSCTNKPNTNPSIGNVTSRPALTGDDILRGAKVFGQTLAVSLDQGIALERTLAREGTIDPRIEPKIREKLQKGKQGVERFNARIAKYDHFSLESKEDIANFLDEVIAFIADLNNDGILEIKDSESQLIASGIIAGAQVAVTIYKSTFDQVK